MTRVTTMEVAINFTTYKVEIKSQVLENLNPVISSHIKSVTEEEAEYISLLDGFGPWFEDCWGTRILPIEADLLPEKIPVYKTPFRLLPTGMCSGLANSEMTNFRKLAKSLPCHCALGISYQKCLIFWRGIGNANFYFATAMTYACFQIIMVVKSVSTMLNYDRKLRKLCNTKKKLEMVNSLGEVF